MTYKQWRSLQRDDLIAPSDGSGISMRCWGWSGESVDEVAPRFLTGLLLPSDAERYDIVPKSLKLAEKRVADTEAKVRNAKRFYVWLLRESLWTTSQIAKKLKEPLRRVSRWDRELENRLTGLVENRTIGRYRTDKKTILQGFATLQQLDETREERKPVIRDLIRWSLHRADIARKLEKAGCLPPYNCYIMESPEQIKTTSFELGDSKLRLDVRNTDKITTSSTLIYLEQDIRFQADDWSWKGSCALMAFTGDDLISEHKISFETRRRPEVPHGFTLVICWKDHMS